MTEQKKSLPEFIKSLIQTESVSTLPYQHFIVKGSDAFEFLQGQLTLNINKIDDNICLPAGYCNHKGQLFAVIWVYRQNGSLHIFLHDENYEKVLKRLKMFVMRSDVTFSELNTVTTIMSPEKAKTQCKTLPKKHGEKKGEWVKVGHETNYYLNFSNSTEPVSPLNTLALRLCTGVIEIYEKTYEKLLPFQCGVSDLKGISYDKGCYVGQEVIAINKYRGKNNKHLCVAYLPLNDNDDVVLKIGEILRSDNAVSIGTLIDYVKTDKNLYLQMIVSERTINTEIVFMGQNVLLHRLFN